jgi:hypothetical protein
LPVALFRSGAAAGGLPADVAALVHSLGDTATQVTLVNTGDKPRRVIVQGGAYGEHRIDSVSVDGRQHRVGARHFTLDLAPGAGARLELGMARYANRPSLSFPWG